LNQRLGAAGTRAAHRSTATVTTASVTWATVAAATTATVITAATARRTFIFFLELGHAFLGEIVGDVFVLLSGWLRGEVLWLKVVFTDGRRLAFTHIFEGFLLNDRSLGPAVILHWRSEMRFFLESRSGWRLGRPAAGETQIVVR